MNDIEVAEQLQIPGETLQRWRSQGARIPEDPTDPSQLTELARWIGEREEQAVRTGAQFPQTVLSVGFITAIVLAGLLFLGTIVYLALFLSTASTSITSLVQDLNTDRLPADSVPMVITAQMMVVKMTLLSCGIFVGAAVGFLGFSLLLLGIRSTMATDGSRAGLQAKLINLAPGALVLLCAAILVGVCATGDLSLNTDFPAPRTVEVGEAEDEAAEDQIAIGLNRAQTWAVLDT
jgi:hypothetical protein